ncbi:hypothetical protein EI427_01845 [Flammeovirga pectinis]|uniref:T9SS type A sorting domain-containing protein n=1 Tax=Flammeovirga pectinis TaxID=2494373 RepID=A0A3Q9FLL4_9BACT|nr:polymer-forming cytoskeletal protein [Flammeovirga pectinis]AZQ61002.1 hypothetical protein EI427_01845 [Flammeovirga pectinis]
MYKFTLLSFLFGLFPLITFAVDGESFVNIKPQMERFTSIDQWENPNNWSPKVVPNEKTLILVKGKSFIIDFNLKKDKQIVGAIDVSHGGELVITNRGNLFITNTLTVGPKSSLVVEGQLTVQEAIIQSTDAEFTVDQIGAIDAHELTIKIEDYAATINGHISTTYLTIHFLDKNGQLQIGDEAEIHVQSETIVKNRYQDNILGDIRKITTSGCSGNKLFCNLVTAYHLKLPTIVDFFDIEIENGHAFAYWETSIERDLSHFVIEKSHDGIAFEEIGKVQASGNSHEAVPYDHKDVAFTDTKDTFYRLRTIQQSGEEYIWCRHLKANENDKEEYGLVKINPNPTNYKLALDLEGESFKDFDIKLHHTENESVWDIMPEFEENQALFDIHHYPAGTYILKVKMKDLLVYSGNVIIHATNSRGNIKNSQAIILEED